MAMKLSELRKMRGADEKGHWRDPELATEDGWRQVLSEDGHVPFVLDGVEYFIFPIGEHSYGMDLWSEAGKNPNPRWQFNSEDEVLSRRLFAGKSIAERLDDILAFEGA